MKIHHNKLNKDAPHQAVILIKAEIMERLPNGQMTGLPVAIDSKTVSFIGKDFNECKQHVERFMNDTIKK